MSELRKYADGSTGREVWQVTSHSAGSEAVYFEGCGFTADEEAVVFRSSRTGSPNLYRAELASGEIAPLLEEPPAELRGWNMHPDGRRAVYAAGRALMAVDVASRSVQTLAELPPSIPGQFRGFCPCFAVDGRFCAAAVVNSLRGQHTSLCRADLTTGEVIHVLGWGEGFSHPMVNPHDSDLLTFIPPPASNWNMDLPDSERTRTWMVRVSDGRPRKFLTPVRYRTITHESWSRDGQRLFFYDKTYPLWCPVSICSVDREGGDWQCHFTSYEHWLGHGQQSPDGKKFISDSQKPDDNALIEIDLAGGRGEVVCRPNATHRGAHLSSSHVHPSYSPTGKYVCYTSDFTASPQVYVVPMA